MKPTYARRYRRSSPTKTEGAFFKKEMGVPFFGSSHETFFSPAVSLPQAIQRKCEGCEKDDKKVQRAEDKKEEKKLQRKPNKKEEEKLQKKEGTAPSPASISATTNYIRSLGSKGHPLPRHQQQFFGQRMGHDFSNVKIHHDKEAAESAKEVNAKAYTIGNDIVFNDGQYNTESAEGKKLIAHELVHVVQNGYASSGIKRKVNYTAPAIIETDPVTTVLNTPRLALTTPIINGRRLPDNLAAAGDILFAALGQLYVERKDKKTTCKLREPEINCGTQISILEKPTAKVWQGSAPGTRFAHLSKACGNVSTVTVTIKGKGDVAAIAVYNKIMTNEKEHVSDFNKSSKKYLEPLVALLARFSKEVSDDPSKAEKECQDALIATAFQPILNFLKEIDTQVKSRDRSGGTHDFKPQVTVDGKNCSKVVVNI